MFNKTTKTEAAAGTSINLIGNGTTITGDVNANGDIRIDGILTGNIQITGKLVIGPSGRIEGNITCQNADVSGEVNGTIQVSDLLALKAARYLGIQRHVVLPFSRSRFRAISVTDRPGEWGTLFDQVIREAEDTRNLVLLNESKEDTAALLRTNRAILNKAQMLAASFSQNMLAVIVWDGLSRGEDDLTADFADEARFRGIPVREIKTQ